MPMRVTDRESGEEFELDWTDALSADLQRHSDAGCTHPKTEIRSTVVAGGALHFRYQCQLCGELVGHAIRKALVPPDCPPKDELLFVRYRAERRREYEEILQNHLRKQKAEGSEWWIKYNAYLKSPEWHALRQKILQRARGVCEGCGAAVPTQVHHTTYAHVFHEFLFELVAVCDGCHGRLHQDAGSSTDEWKDGFPCEGCRWQSEKGPRRWCGQFDVLAVEALSVNGQCGPERAALEPLR